MDRRHDQPVPRSTFLPLAALPVADLAAGGGRVELYLSPSGFEADAAAAALTVLLRAEDAKSERLLLEVSDRFAGAEDRSPLTRVSTARVWRSGVAATGGRRRDWVLLLEECRAAYATTLIALGGSDPGLQTRLAGLADRTVVVSRAGRGELAHTHRLVRRLRGDGVYRCECMWLDAA
ncbi:hypothetical protein Pla123a_34210 [Posidoniimonas polymericola]|uniref:Uncharacterized protein n=1 Tax=Posidoniimonas polymericola TaxID=2528002 RepID=A0A5C5YIA4_9BACT|nr:hypothetical protein [Posidoniimonas polymericola]TWT74597.1 hypothetical protein Pla123a_34210 [Posidoniimonas polymericola]